MSNEIRDQFVRDMQVAGLSAGTQEKYLSSVDLFFKSTWLSPEAVTQKDVQGFLIGLRERDVARETFRGYRFALECLLANTLGRDWPLFKKNSARRRSSVCRRR
jgi:Phage integrase, N-terminal SAM-like domain